MTHSVEAYRLLWPPAFQQAAREEGWRLHVTSGSHVEIDYDPIPDGMPRSTLYKDLIFAILVDAYIRLSPMHRIAWEFEYASNEPLYRDGVVPGDPGRAGEEQYWDEREAKWKAVVK